MLTNNVRRVVVTGLGAVTPLGGSVDHSWNRLINAESGITQIGDLFDTSDINCKIAAPVPLRHNNSNDYAFDLDLYIKPKEQRRMDSFIQFGIASCEQAILDANLGKIEEDKAHRIGVMMGSGIGGLKTIEKHSIEVHEKGARHLTPFFIPASLINMISGHISIRHGYRGPNHSVVTACATGSHAIGDAFRLIKYGHADVMLTGGAEASICRVGIAGFASMRALSSKYNDTPQKASRPWDKDRDGFVMGEGSGTLVLEEYDHAKKRGAKIYCEITGYGLSGDGYHMTASHPEGLGAQNSMNDAMKEAEISPDHIDYINAHATSTPVGDAAELKAIQNVFGNRDTLLMSSTKSSIGHLLGATGAVESIFSILAMRNGIVPATLNLDNPPEGCKIDLVPHKPKEKKLDHVLSNTFGFGGTNASLVFSKISD